MNNLSKKDLALVTFQLSLAAYGLTKTVKAIVKAIKK